MEKLEKEKELLEKIKQELIAGFTESQELCGNDIEDVTIEIVSEEALMLPTGSGFDGSYEIHISKNDNTFLGDEIDMIEEIIEKHLTSNPNPGRHFINNKVIIKLYYTA